MRTLRARAERGHDAGFTLIEIVIAMVIFGAMATAVVGIILQSQSLGVSNRNRVAASNLAARELDLVRQEFAATKTAPVALANAGSVTNPHPLAGGTAGSPLVVDGTAYTVVRSAQWNITGTGASACEGGSLVSYPTLGVTVSVTWPGMGSVQPVVQTAALAPDKTTGIPTTSSFIAAKVVDQDAQPLVGVPVTATGGSSTTGTTDATGCAVIQVNPAVDPGTTYSVTVADASYVDISGATNPSKTTGLLKRGSLYAGAGFAVAHGGTITLNLVRADGQPLSSAQVAGSTVSLVAPEFSGSSSVKQFTVTGTTTTLSGLWPTKYGAFFGTTEPAGGYTSYTLDPGGSLTIDVEFEMASAPVANLPAGTSSIVAVAAGTATTCAVGQGVTLPAGAPSATVSLLPGSYDLYATGLGFSCSPGPTAVPLAAGPNDEVAWGSTTLQLSSVPSGGTLWALNRAASGVTSLTTCPGGSGASAVNIDGARSGAVALPAGSWWVYQTNGAATGACTSYPDVINPVPVAYNQANTRVWASTPLYANLTLKSMSTGRFFVVSTAAATCTATQVNTSGQAYSVGTTTSWVTSLTQAVPRPTSGTTTYYAYQWNKSSTQPNKCSTAGTFIVGPSTANLPKDVNTGTVGP